MSWMLYPATRALHIEAHSIRSLLEPEQLRNSVTVMIWMVWMVHCFWKYQVAKRDVHVPHPQIPVLYLVQFSTRNASAFILRARHKLSATVTEDSSEFMEQFLLFSFHCKRSFKNKFLLLMGIKEVYAMGISVEFPQTSKQTNKK